MIYILLAYGGTTCKCPQGFTGDPYVRCNEPDPCEPSPCGPGAVCTTNIIGNAICRCEPGLIPKPDTITGCGPECVIDPDCSSDYICENQKCVEKPDTCTVGARELGDKFCDDDANNEACNFDQGNLLKSIDKKTFGREDI